MSPIFAVIIQSLVDNVDNVGKLSTSRAKLREEGLVRGRNGQEKMDRTVRIVRRLGYLLQLSHRGPPILVGGGLPHLDLDVRIALGKIFPTQPAMLFSHACDVGRDYAERRTLFIVTGSPGAQLAGQSEEAEPYNSGGRRGGCPRRDITTGHFI